ncbi:MAG: DUF421 domain-containing protein [Bacillota bacterium]
MENIINPAIRTIFTYIVLMILSRFLGRKIISQMTFFDFVVGITIGSVAANHAFGPYNSITAGFTILILLALLTFLVDYAHIKSFRARKMFESEPVVLIDRGTIVNQNLKRERLSIEDLTMMLRQKNAFNIADVEFAVMEPDGKLSVQKKSEKQPLTPSDINFSPPYKGLTRDVIMDGNILDENLKNTKFTKELLIDNLKMYGVKDVSEVFYAGLDSSNRLYVSKRLTNTKEKHGQYGIE